MLTDYLNYLFSVQGIKKIIELFEQNKYDIRFVGGCVRDALLNNKSSEIDFAINCEPNTIAQLLKENNINGSKFIFLLYSNSFNDCPDINEIYPGINGKTHGDKKLISPALNAINNSNMFKY